MNKVFFILVLFFFSTSLFSQDPNYSLWTKELTDKANTAKDIEYLSAEEKKVIYLCNLARLDGKLFIKTYLKDYDSGNDSYIRSLRSDLRKVKNLPVLYPSKKLYDAAYYHAKDMGDKGKIGHTSSDGTSFSKRVRKYVSGGGIAENCSYGHSSALGIVMQLLIDRGVPSLGHRINILNPAYQSVGVSIYPHKSYRYNCVMDFSSKKVE